MITTRNKNSHATPSFTPVIVPTLGIAQAVTYKAIFGDSDEDDDDDDEGFKVFCDFTSSTIWTVLFFYIKSPILCHFLPMTIPLLFSYTPSLLLLLLSSTTTTTTTIIIIITTTTIMVQLWRDILVLSHFPCLYIVIGFWCPYTISTRCRNKRTRSSTTNKTQRYLISSILLLRLSG